MLKASLLNRYEDEVPKKNLIKLLFKHFDHEMMNVNRNQNVTTTWLVLFFAQDI